MADIQWILRLGLGRGIDATDPKPWQHISSFQALDVTAENVVVTDGIAKKEDFQEDIKSVVDNHAEIHALTKKSGIASIGIFAENSRSLRETKKVVGSRVMTRTITFQSGFDKLPIDSVGSGTAYLGNLTCSGASVDKKVQNFEESLCAWILQRIKARQHHVEEKTKLDPVAAGTNTKPTGNPLSKSPASTSPCSSNPISQLSEYIHRFEQGSSELRGIAKDCDHFVRKGAGGARAITHYVYQLKLGAFEYEIFTQADYNSKFHLRGEVSGENPEVVGVEAGGNFRQSKTNEHRSARGKSVGKIRDDTVDKGTEDEKVIGVEIKPIHTLVNNLLYLRQVLMEAESNYIREKQDQSEGPFLIWCNEEDNKIYLKVHERTSVVGTLERKEASVFYLLPSTNEEYPHEFSLEHTSNEMGNHNGCNQCRFLNAHVNLFGHNSGPLKVKDYVKPHDARLTLHGRHPSEGGIQPVHIRSWGNGPFFFKCARRKRRFDGYIAMTRQSQSSLHHGASSLVDYEYTTKCVRQKSEHNKPHTWLLFNLEPHEEDCEMERERQRPKLNHDLHVSRENWLGQNFPDAVPDTNNHIT